MLPTCAHRYFFPPFRMSSLHFAQTPKERDDDDDDDDDDDNDGDDGDDDDDDDDCMATRSIVWKI